MIKELCCQLPAYPNFRAIACFAANLVFLMLLAGNLILLARYCPFVAWSGVCIYAASRFAQFDLIGKAVVAGVLIVVSLCICSLCFGQLSVAATT